MSEPRRGAALLEVLVATVLVATIGVALIRLTQESSATTRTLAAREVEVLQASALLREAVVAVRSGTWPSRLRVSRHGMTVHTTPASPGVWQLTVASVEGGREVLSTFVRGPQ